MKSANSKIIEQEKWAICFDEEELSGRIWRVCVVNMTMVLCM
jgi:hypothetical protein